MLDPRDDTTLGITEDRILTWPNAVTVVRLLLIPVFLYLLFGLEARWEAAALLGLIGATDWVDGYLARRLDQISELGKVLDPTADRLVLVVGVVSIIIDGSVPLWFGVATLVREVAVGATAIVLALLGARRFDVTWWGKCGTFGLLVSYPMFLAGNSSAFGADLFMIGAWVFGIPGLIFSYLSAAEYIPIARDALKRGRVAR
ncbi:MAG: CDP-alcohol phosphatidyltransferase family protein [Acidobacteria bacterium]|nr:CDP-alcohol phosphatidyltransferase family protein [Acidobacteriota bacterium]